jgi:protease-4
VGASGTYFTAVAGHKIYAEPDTLTGSIGVIGGKLVAQGLLDKLGVHEDFIGRGALSGVELDRPYTPAERQVLTAMVEETYQDFVSKVARCRKLPEDQVAALAEGRVYTARQAKKLGLIDELGTLNDAIAAAKQAAGLKPDEDVEIVRYPEERSIFDLFSGDKDDEATLRLAAQSAGIPLHVLQRLSLPAFLFRADRSGRTQLHYWAAIPRIQ